jgi:hypothetical protein
VLGNSSNTYLNGKPVRCSPDSVSALGDKMAHAFNVCVPIWLGQLASHLTQKN